MATKSKQPRPVRIELQACTWMVLYTDRKYKQWHSPAQFYAPDTSLEYVKEWVHNNPNLTLVDYPGNSDQV